MDLNKIINFEWDLQPGQNHAGPSVRESFIGYVQTVLDALLLCEAFRNGNIKGATKAINKKIKGKVKSGSTYMFIEGTSGIMKWNDGHSWSTLGLKGHFVFYQEKYEGGIPLIKKTTSFTTKQNQVIRIINYYYQHELDNNLLKTPSQLDYFNQFAIPENFYSRVKSSRNETPLKSIYTTYLNAYSNIKRGSKGLDQEIHSIHISSKYENYTTTDEAYYSNPNWPSHSSILAKGSK